MMLSINHVTFLHRHILFIHPFIHHVTFEILPCHAILIPSHVMPCHNGALLAALYRVPFDGLV